jgi:hypothetical protein
MIFGIPHRFGIECSLMRSYQGQSIIGDLWLWAKDLRIGDKVSGVDLPLILDKLAGPLRIKDRCQDDFFDRLTKEQVVDFFKKLIFTNEKVAEVVAERGLLFRRYLVISAPDLEGFDSVFLILLGRSDGGDRLIWKWNETETVHEFHLDRGEYEACVLSCFDWLEEQTGYRSPQRSWLGLQEYQRDELRRAILTQRPQLHKPENWELLDQAAIEKLNKRL